MEELIFNCKKIIALIDVNYPYEKNYTGAVKDIYTTVGDILEHAEKNEVISKKIDFFSLARCFVDQTIHYNSQILFILDDIERILNELKEKN